MSKFDPYPLQNTIRLSAEEAELQRRRAHGEAISKEEFEIAKARTIRDHWRTAGRIPPNHTLEFIVKWLGAY